MDEPVLQIEGRLSVREEESAFLVVREEDPDDWLARFEKDGHFPAREWAENMANVYNRRLTRRPTGPPTPPWHASWQLPSRAVGPAAIHSSRERMSERIREGPL